MYYTTEYGFIRFMKMLINSGKITTLAIAVLLAISFDCTSAFGERDSADYYLDKVDSTLTIPPYLSASLYTEVLDYFRYHAGDDSAYADRDFDDSDWPVIQSGFNIDSLPDNDWKGIGWFRANLRVAPEMAKVPILLSAHHLGAMEIFLDGRLVERYGMVSPKPSIEEEYINSQYKPAVFQVDDTLSHILAIRYSNSESRSYFRFDSNHGFHIILSKYSDTIDDAIDFVRVVNGHNLAFTVAPVLLGIIHLFFFIFYRKARNNLHFALFAFSLAVLPLSLVLTERFPSYRAYELLFWVMKISVITMSAFGVAFLYSVFYGKLLKTFWVIGAVGLLLIAFSWWLPIELIYSYSIITLIEVSRVVILAVKRRLPGSWLIGLGILSFIAASIYVMLVDASMITSPTVNSYLLYLYGMAILVLSMSVYLGWGMARTNKILERQITQVKELSEKNLEQERLAKEQQMRQALLETEINYRRKEAEKARELAEALKNLEKAHRELQDTQSQLVQSEKMASLGQLVAGIAHEINTPVGAVSSMHDTTRRAVDKLKKQIFENCRDEKQRIDFENSFKLIEDNYKVIDEGTGRVVNIVRRLKSFARLDEAELKSVDIHEGIEDTLTLIHHEIKHGIKVNRKYGGIPNITCFPGQLNQVFLNMLINAKHAIKDRGEITIRTGLIDNKVFIEISDTGEGIEPENLSHIFDPGFTTKGVGVGTGLGLAICYQIIHDHMGDIKVKSERGKGATFTIILPTDLNSRINDKKNDGNR